MPRLLFEKKGNSVWISHLDLMRLFQRAFKRAGLPLTHTQGFNPRPSVSIALPLSVGVESNCELLEFDLSEYNYSNEQIRDLLNNALVEGIRVLEVYDQGRKYRDLLLLSCTIALDYDKGVPTGGVEAVRELFARPSLVLPKKTKSGIQDQDIIPMIKRLAVTQDGENTILLDALICCQNPTLNPAQLTLAVQTFLPELAPDGCRYQRKEIYDDRETIFR